MKKFISLGLMFLLSAGCAFSAENMLNSIELTQKNNGYELRVKTDAPVESRKKIESKNSVYFELKNVSADDKVDTIYNDVENVDGVVIQQIDKSKLRIYVNALEAANTKLISEASEVIESEKPEVVINRPRSEYAPILGEERYQEKADWENNGFNSEYLLSAILEKIKTTNIDYTFLISICVVLASLVGLKKAFSKVKIEDDEPMIGIAPSHKQIFEELRASERNATPNQELIQKLNKQIETPRTNPISGYGLNTYQKAQNSNPYQGATISQPQRRIVEPPKQTFTTNVVNKKPINKGMTVSGTAAGARNIDNIKFLESVTKIYEQSGRKDLAQGLKANLNKSKIAM